MNSTTELQSIVMQMEAQITQDLCKSLHNETEQLLKVFEARPNLLIPVKMLNAIGNYMKINLDKSHPDTWPMLKTIADKIEALADLEKIDKKDVQPLVDHYRLFQNKLASRPDVDFSEVEKLKVAILAVDWEISDKNLNNFQSALSGLMDKFKDYHVQFALLKMIQGTGRYIAIHKVNAHSDSLVFIKSIFDTFEQIIQTPDMPMAGKMDLLKQSLNKFQEFKSKISAQPKPAAEPSPDQKPDPAQPRVPEKKDKVPDVTPALSHLGSQSGTGKADEDISSLTTLDEDSTPNPAEVEALAPALSGKAPAPQGSGDVMDDLFTIKESPADELLDAIHLLDVHGSGPDKAMSMLDATSGSSSEDAKSYTPTRPANEPIPEIGDRLDEFFNLESTPDEPKTQSESEIIQDEIDIDTIDEAEDIESEDIEAETADDVAATDQNVEEVQLAQKNDTAETLTADTDEIIESIRSELILIKDNKTTFEKSDFDEKIDLLKHEWGQRPNEMQLIEIIESALQLIALQVPEKQKVEDAPDEDTPAPDKDAPDKGKPPGGLMARIKRIFSS